MGVNHLLKKVGQKGADKIAKLSALSPEQLEKIEQKREEYLSQNPSMDDSAAEELTQRLIAASSVEIYNAYLPQIQELYVPIQESAEFEEEFNTSHNIRYFKITKWVTDEKENSLEKLVNVYQVLSNEQCNIALIFHRMCDKTDVYLAVTNTENARDNIEIESYKNRLIAAIRGNFPGSQLDEDGKGIPSFLDNNYRYSVATASNIPTEKSEKFTSQTIEKLIDGIIPDSSGNEYTIILLATPIQDIEQRKLRLGEFYTSLFPYSTWNTNFTFVESSAQTSMASFGVNVGASAGIQNGINQATTDQRGTTESDTTTTGDSTSKGSSTTESLSTGTQESHADTSSVSNSEGTFKSATGGGGLHLGSKEIGIDINGSTTGGSNTSQAISQGVSDTTGTSVTESVAKGITENVTKNFSHALGRAVTQSIAKTEGISKNINFGGNFGANFARSSTVTATVGKNEGIQQNFSNYNIKHALKLLEEQMERYDKSSALGLWEFAAYVLSEDQNMANNVAHSYLALTQGEKSYMTQSAVNLWRGDTNDSDDAKEICRYLRSLRHPLFGLNPDYQEQDMELSVYPSIVSATTSLSGKELAFSLNFPKKSISGLPVLTCAEFGRSIVSYDGYQSNQKRIYLGNIFHMNHEERLKAYLSANSLASHTFITGSTGSGKSNTVYQIISEAKRKGIRFLVVEPAKGEYKDVLGMQRDVQVYGTNPYLTPMLRLNPFSFPKGIHVLEHLDRLVEIFNVCWPMYAAMPAVLKNAIEKSYEDCGWDLTTSSNPYGYDLYPSFKDVARNIRTIIDTSEYDAENKGAYKGSLLTRLNSLCNGIYGMIFTQDEIAGKDLFDKNVIVDLSRVGSMETKSLLMGMMVLKLQEYRITHAETMNADLKHITVLEEAHNILKRTSTQQISEGSNLLGKSVEMISNAIAEMRTYGEGFIIADQAPGLLDMSVIRNTNTKIIMRLPDQSDRELVGKAANLNEAQIRELAKLPRGVAAVYQNEWVQPVLCKIKKYEYDEEKYSTTKYLDYDKTHNPKDAEEISKILSEGVKITKENQLKDLKEKMNRMHLDASVQVSILKWVSNPPEEPRMTKMAPIMAELYPDVLNQVKKVCEQSNDPEDWTKAAEQSLSKHYDDVVGQVRRDIIQSVITYYFYFQVNDIHSLQSWIEGGYLR